MAVRIGRMAMRNTINSMNSSANIARTSMKFGSSLSTKRAGTILMIDMIESEILCGVAFSRELWSYVQESIVLSKTSG